MQGTCDHIPNADGTLSKKDDDKYLQPERRLCNFPLVSLRSGRYVTRWHQYLHHVGSVRHRYLGVGWSTTARCRFIYECHGATVTQDPIHSAKLTLGNLPWTRLVLAVEAFARELATEGFCWGESHIVGMITLLLSYLCSQPCLWDDVGSRLGLTTKQRPVLARLAARH